MLTEILPIIGAFILSMTCGVFFIPSVLKFCKKKKLYDIPTLRKVHSAPIPRLGGIAFIPSMMISAVAVLLIIATNNIQDKISLSMWSVGFILSLSIIYSVGIIDDLIGLNAKVKFAAQILAASIMPICGLQINDLYGLFGIYEIPSSIGIPLTIFTFVFIDNALNLIDGIDGLATSLSIIALLGFFYCFIPYNLIAYEVMIAGLVGVLTVYLYYNMWGKVEKGTKIFMGDSGSLTLGFFLAFLFVKAIAVNPNIMPMSPKRVLIAYSLLIIPTFDVVRVVLHRIRNRKPIFDADKSHIHHKILAMGYPTLYVILYHPTYPNFRWHQRNTWQYEYRINRYLTYRYSPLYDATHRYQSKNQTKEKNREMTKQNKTETKNRNNRMERFVKRSTDILVSVPCLVLSSPLFVIISLAIKWEDGLPIIYKQERIGLHGKPFNIYKFRSMKADAEKDGPNLLEIEGDTRLTRVGKFIRAHHLDELPQLWNIVKGDMSLVGPRPERKYYIDQIIKHDPRYTYLYQIRPGATSYATLYNGYTDTMPKMLRRLSLDLYYLEHRSWWFDAKILFKTMMNILFGKIF